MKSIVNARHPGGALVLAAAALLAACGGGGGADAPVTPPPSSAPEALATAQSGEVLGYVRQKLAARGPTGVLTDGLGVPAWLMVTTATSTDTSGTGTVVQEAGVDEEDLIKADGDRIYTVHALKPEAPLYERKVQLDVHTGANGGRLQLAGSRVLDGVGGSWGGTRGLLLAQGQPRLAVVGESIDGTFSIPDCAFVCGPSILPWEPVNTMVELQLVEAQNPAAIPAPTRWQIDGRLVGTRQVGNTLVVVARHQPRLAFDTLPTTSTPAERQAVLDRMTVADLLPRIRINGGQPQPLVAETDCWIQPANASAVVQVTTITTVDLSSPTWARSSRCFVGGSEAMYMAPTSLYLATTRYEVTIQNDRLTFPTQMSTDIHKFRLDAGTVGYRGSGTVAGSLGWAPDRRPYHLSEHEGLLRVLSFTGVDGWLAASDAARVAASPATLTILRDDTANRRLEVVSTLPNARRPDAIGKAGEQLYGVRFAGDRGYAVTFRRTDPLYVLDLSDPADPRVAGALEVPGFSDWLYPVDGGLLLGVGKDADVNGRVQGVKVALFDVRDAARPALIDGRSFGAAGSYTALDYTSHGLAWQNRDGVARVALPMTLVAAMPGLAQQVLQRIEVDSAQRTLRFKDAIDLGSGWIDFDTRALIWADQVHLLSQGALQSWGW